MRRAAWAVLLCAAGCYSPVGELVATHVEAGGTISAALDGGAMMTTKALADATGEPMLVNGTSAFLVFGLVVGDDDVSGMPGKVQLLAGHAVQMTVSASSRAQLSVHANQRSCAATSATVHLTPDGKGRLDGDFSGNGDGCALAGTLSAIPIEQ